MNQEQIDAIALSIAEELPELFWLRSLLSEEVITKEECKEFARRLVAEIQARNEPAAVVVTSTEKACVAEWSKQLPEDTVFYTFPPDYEKLCKNAERWNRKEDEMTTHITIEKAKVEQWLKEFEGVVSGNYSGNGAEMVAALRAALDAAKKVESADQTIKPSEFLDGYKTAEQESKEIISNLKARIEEIRASKVLLVKDLEALQAKYDEVVAVLRKTKSPLDRYAAVIDAALAKLDADKTGEV